MAAVEPYAPCPCGSGQKFKWCCHKVEGYADRAQRLVENGQVAAALDALDEGLRKEPGNPWLLTRRAVILVHDGRVDEAKAALRKVVEAQPKHMGARMLLTRVVLETEGPEAGVREFQRTLGALPPAERGGLAPLARVVGSILAQVGHIPSARMHLELAFGLAPGAQADPDNPAVTALRAIERDPAVSPWLKATYELAAAPAGLDGPALGRFDAATELAGQGLWGDAALEFEGLIADPVAGPEAARNAGLCRLWQVDDASAVAHLRRYIATLGTSAEAVDLEALCQQVAPLRPDDSVERVQLIWPLRDRDRLLATLRAVGDVHEEGKGPIDPTDPESPEVDEFALLDRPAADADGIADLKPGQIPRIVARVLVGAEIVAMEAYDDGRLDALGDRFTALARTSIAPAHPRTKVLGTVDRATQALTWEWLLPEGLSRAAAERLESEQRAEQIRTTWPATPLAALDGRTPLQASKAKTERAVVALRAAVALVELGRTPDETVELRAKLGIEPEPEFDPETVEIDRVHPARLHLVPADRLSDAKLAQLYRAARRAMLGPALDRAARAVVDRPSAWGKDGVDPLTAFADLATMVADRGDQAEAMDLVRRGRLADAPARRAQNAPMWDILEVRLKARGGAPETWVPDLAVVLERYGSDPEANRTILMNLLEMGLVQMAPDPDRPDDVLLDSRPLQAVLARFGPKVTTASGRLGVAATKPEIWTPGGPASGGGGGGALWTPGSGSGQAPPPGGGPKLIVPGR